MLSAARIRELFEALDQELAGRSVVGEIGLLGGAVMCLVFQAREATRDVDAIFAPTREIREAAGAVARAYGLPADWLNDAAKGFVLSLPPRTQVLDLPNLRVWAPTAEYLLAMKCVSARYDTHDADDVAFLIRHLGLVSPDEVFERITRFYPRERVPARTRFLVEELLGASVENAGEQPVLDTAGWRGLSHEQVRAAVLDDMEPPVGPVVASGVTTEDEDPP